MAYMQTSLLKPMLLPLQDGLPRFQRIGLRKYPLGDRGSQASTGRAWLLIWFTIWASMLSASYLPAEMEVGGGMKEQSSPGGEMGTGGMQMELARPGISETVEQEAFLPAAANVGWSP